jgi:D-glycero-D-manno-heptose 1,7-bisphosphate phosphatase
VTCPASASTARRAAFLDRDGVLTRSHVRGGRPFAPRRLEDFDLLPGAAAAVSALRDAGFLTIVVTNQKDVGAGLLQEDTLDEMHRILRQSMELDAIYVCTCVDECPCYKPNPGMLLEAAQAFEIDLANSYMIGDRWRDISAGRRAGVRTVFIDLGYSEALPDPPNLRATDLPDAVEAVLREIRYG